jgi:hypothetical protein
MRCADADGNPAARVRASRATLNSCFPDVLPIFPTSNPLHADRTRDARTRMATRRPRPRVARAHVAPDHEPLLHGRGATALVASVRRARARITYSRRRMRVRPCHACSGQLIESPLHANRARDARTGMATLPSASACRTRRHAHYRRLRSRSSHRRRRSRSRSGCAPFCSSHTRAVANARYYSTAAPDPSSLLDSSRWTSLLPEAHRVLRDMLYNIMLELLVSCRFGNWHLILLSLEVCTRLDLSPPSFVECRQSARLWS